MKELVPTKAFVIACIAALVAAYAIGLGIRRIRFKEAQALAKVVAKSKKPAEEPAKNTEAAKPGINPETPDQPTNNPSPEEEPRLSDESTQPTREQFANVFEEERPEPMRERFGGRRREGRPRLSQQGGRPQLSEGDHSNLREEMRELMERRDEMTEEEMKKAQSEILERYGFPSR